VSARLILIHQQLFSMPDKLTDAEARAQLSSAGISVNSPKPKTSLDGVRQETISGIIKFKKDFPSCNVIITGGTEPGHAAGTKSHANGYKLDIGLNGCVDKAIQGFRFIGNRSDNAPQYTSASGFIYANEGNHWDITFP
jgi:hypothetical protein